MTPGRRLAILLVALALISAPAAALRAVCAGESCAGAERSETPAPFCSLDPRTRELISAGFYEGRSPDALGVSGTGDVVAPVPGGLEVPWPASNPDPGSLRVPVVFTGERIEPFEIQGEVGLNHIAPTLEKLLGIERPHAEVRSGRAIEGVVRPGDPVNLIVIVVWKGAGAAEMPAPGELGELVRTLGGTLSGRKSVSYGEATAGSLPLDPAAILTTIGTGGLPSQHGMTGSSVRNDDGLVVGAFGPRSPIPVIAALGDDLDELTDGEAMVGLVASHASDRGLIGGTWYGSDDDDVLDVGSRDPAASVREMLARGFASDGAPDLLGVTLSGSTRDMEADTVAIARTVFRDVEGVALVVTGTGSLARAGAVPVEGLWMGNTEIASPAAGGLFIDRTKAEAKGVTTQQVVDAAAQLAAPGGSPLFADVFPAFAVRFGEYC